MMERAPDEIKKGLEEELPVHYHIDGEPRLTPRQYMELQLLHKDALALIQELQDDNAQQARCIENMTDKLNAMNDEAAKLQAERDAMIEELKNAYSCFACKKFYRNGGECKAGSVCMMRDFEWRGVQKEDAT